MYKCIGFPSTYKRLAEVLTNCKSRRVHNRIDVRDASLENVFSFAGGEQRSPFSVMAYLRALDVFHPPT